VTARRGAVIGGLVAAALLLPLAALHLSQRPLGPWFSPGQYGQYSVETYGGTASLSNGMQVTLERITAPGNGGIPLSWRPHSEYLTEDILHHSGIYPAANHVFSARITNPARPLLGIRWCMPAGAEIQNGNWSYARVGGRYEYANAVGTAHVPGTMRASDLSLGLAAEPFVIATRPLPGRPGKRQGVDLPLRYMSRGQRIRLENGAYISPDSEGHGLLLVTLPRTRDLAYRVVLVDWLGRRIPADSTASYGGRHVHIGFTKTNPRFIRGVELQASRYRWITFKNVRLKPPVPGDAAGNLFVAQDGVATLPDGTSVALKKVVPEGGVSSTGSRFGGNTRTLRLDFSVAPVPPFSQQDFISVAVDGNGVSAPSRYSYPSVGSHPPEALKFSAFVSAPVRGRRAVIRVPVGSQRWHTVASTRIRENGLGGMHSEGDFTVRKGALGSYWWEIELPTAVRGRRFRIVAVDTGGRIHPAEGAWGSGQGGFYPPVSAHMPLSFPRTARNRIVEVRIQVAPYDWVEFRDVPLTPDKP